ncbi:MAG: hypothetical protein GEU94_09625, partial [Micromonosporaceae bacterium]|nr:hypothetical protein [Micromonosporaceae bacterium]
VGELSEQGVLQPTRRSFSHTFEVRYQQTAEGLVWLVAEPPTGYVISEDALEERFDVLPLYFVNQHSTSSLVPDVRYVPKSIEWRKQRNLLVEWLLQGPASWLHGVALRGFPDGTKRRGNVYAERDERVVVSLSSEAEGHARPTLMFAQLAWTLRPRMRGRLEVRIDERPIRYDGRLSQARDEFFSFNAIAARSAGEAYMVSSEGQVEAVPSRSGRDRLPAVLDDAEVKGVDSAAATRAGDLAALVRWHRRKQSLWVGQRANVKVAYQRVTGLPTTDTMSEPVWAGGSKPRSLLVAADGDLYGVDLATLQAGKVQLPKGLGPVRSVSVAPDGYRLALVAGGRVHLGALSSRRKRLQVSASYQVTHALRGVVDVAWSRENHLVVAGVGASGGGLWEVSIDGVSLHQVETPTGDTPDSVAGYPEVAMEVDRRGKVLIEQGGRVYEIYSSRFGNPGNAPSPPQGGAPFYSI